MPPGWFEAANPKKPAPSVDESGGHSPEAARFVLGDGFCFFTLSLLSHLA
jgi:hypothetical protein